MILASVTLKSNGSVVFMSMVISAVVVASVVVASVTLKGSVVLASISVVVSLKSNGSVVLMSAVEVASVVVVLKSVVGPVVVILASVEVVSAIVVVIIGGAMVGQPRGTFGTHLFRVFVPGRVLVSVRVLVVTVLSLPVVVSVLVLFVSVLVPRVRPGLLPLVRVPSVGHSADDGQVHIGCGGHVVGGGHVGSRVSVSFVVCALAELTKHSNTPGNSKIMLIFMM